MAKKQGSSRPLLKTIGRFSLITLFAVLLIYVSETLVAFGNDAGQPPTTADPAALVVTIAKAPDRPDPATSSDVITPRHSGIGKSPPVSPMADAPSQRTQINRILQVCAKIAHEVGFGLVVALLVWLLFEFQINSEQDQMWEKRIDRVSANVFNAVLRRDLPKDLLDEATLLVLDSQLIRENFRINYTLTDGSCEIEAGASAPCVLLRAEMQFTMRNISADSFPFPVSLSLPNPVHPNMKAQVKVVKIQAVHNGKAVTLDLHAAERNFRDGLKDDLEPSVAYKAGEVALAPNDVLEFSAEYIMAKEAEDTELLQSLYPSNGVSIRMVDHGDRDQRVLFARTVHRVHKVAQRSTVADRAISLNISDYVLPQQGILMWWKRTQEGSLTALRRR